MTTLEKLFVQIFEKKEWIIEQIQRQADAYNEQLACRLLIDGITPPPCLLNPRFKFLKSPTSSVEVFVPHGHANLLPNEMSMETHAPKRVLDLPNEPPVTLTCPNDDIGCSLNVVTEQDNNVNSPQMRQMLEYQAFIVHQILHLLEFRVSKSDTHQATQDKCSSEPAKCNDKEELDGGVNLHETSLGSYGAKKSESSKTHDTHRQSKHYSGRITTSRSSRQETSGINEPDTTASCNPKVSYSVWDLIHEHKASNKLLDAVCNDRIGETQAIYSNKSVKKPVISSNISDGLCMLVKPKQLNFDEMEGCDSSKISSLVSKTRKLDGLLGQECIPSMDSVSLKDDKSFEQQLQMENIDSCQSKYARTHSDECTNVEKMTLVWIFFF
ncbi:hypothetical protein L1887_39177 [Cichorium endivia]|nr:hypothetical protein L1887_39177 [Cichorium endivia]